MIRPIMTNEFFLSQSSDLASIADDAVCDDLLDTLEFHRDRCVGLAANMIGVRKCIIVFDDSGKHRVMLNPVIVESEGEYEAEEGCLSLEGARKALRYQRITVKFRDRDFVEHKKRFAGFTAQIIQHEIDHCNGILI